MRLATVSPSMITAEPRLGRSELEAMRASMRSMEVTREVTLKRDLGDPGHQAALTQL